MGPEQPGPYRASGAPDPIFGADSSQSGRFQGPRGPKWAPGARTAKSGRAENSNPDSSSPICPSPIRPPICQPTCRPSRPVLSPALSVFAPSAGNYQQGNRRQAHAPQHRLRLRKDHSISLKGLQHMPVM